MCHSFDKFVGKQIIKILEVRIECISQQLGIQWSAIVYNQDVPVHVIPINIHNMMNKA